MKALTCLAQRPTSLIVCVQSFTVDIQRFHDRRRRQTQPKQDSRGTSIADFALATNVKYAPSREHRKARRNKHKIHREDWMIFGICQQTDPQTHRHTDTRITVLRIPPGGKVKTTFLQAIAGSQPSDAKIYKELNNCAKSSWLLLV